MVHVPRGVTLEHRVYNILLVDAEHVGAFAFLERLVVSRVADQVPHQLPDVLDHHVVLVDVPCRKEPEVVDRTPPDHRPRLRLHGVVQLAYARGVQVCLRVVGLVGLVALLGVAVHLGGTDLLAPLERLGPRTSRGVRPHVVLPPNVKALVVVEEHRRLFQRLEGLGHRGHRDPKHVVPVDVVGARHEHLRHVIALPLIGVHAQLLALAELALRGLLPGLRGHVRGVGCVIDGNAE
mmetsp:Transcript_43900/g.103867  ORF Transcript_43900/g.103867 Transcript_43900/m.103867 type:complete len:236 (+) Transcript_43900:225-932(+)